jgi:hypothetical protein
LCTLLGDNVDDRERPDELLLLIHLVNWTLIRIKIERKKQSNRRQQWLCSLYHHPPRKWHDLLLLCTRRVGDRPKIAEAADHYWVGPAILPRELTPPGQNDRSSNTTAIRQISLVNMQWMS